MRSHDDLHAAHVETHARHDRRISALERASWIVLGAVALVEFLIRVGAVKAVQ